MEAKNEPEPVASDEEPPFGSWVHWYLAVLLTLVVLIIVFYTFTRAFQ